MRLRPEHGTLLGILAVGLVLFILQTGHNLTLPTLRRPASESAAAGSAEPAPAPPAGTESAPGPSGAPAAQAPVAQTSPASKAGSGTASLPPDPPPPAADSPALGIRAEPPVAKVEEPVVVLVSVEGSAPAAEVFFDLRYDPLSLEPVAGMFDALDALASGEERPEMQVLVPEPGRLVAQLRRRPAGSEASAGGDLCALQFIAKRSGSTKVRLERAGVRRAGGDLSGARGAEIIVEAR